MRSDLSMKLDTLCKEDLEEVVYYCETILASMEEDEPEDDTEDTEEIDSDKIGEEIIEEQDEEVKESPFVEDDEETNPAT